MANVTNMLGWIIVVAGGIKRGAVAPKIPKNTFVTKIAPNFFIFCPEPCLGGLQRPFRGQELPPPLSRGVPPRQIPDYVYGLDL